MKNVIAQEANYTSSFVLNKTYYPLSITSGTTSFSVKNDGTAAAPCRLSFTPINDAMLVTITGLSDEPITVSNVMRGQRVVIDGINKTITINGVEAFQRYGGWEFPKLQPGDNVVNMSAANDMSLIEIEFQPRYI